MYTMVKLPHVATPIATQATIIVCELTPFLAIARGVRSSRGKMLSVSFIVVVVVAVMSVLSGRALWMSVHPMCLAMA